MNTENNKKQPDMPASAGFVMALKPATSQETRQPSSLIRLYDLPTAQEKQVVKNTIKMQLSLLKANGVVFDGDYLVSLIEQPLEAFRSQYPGETDDFVIDVRGNEEYVRILLYSRYGQIVQITSRLVSVGLDKVSTDIIEGYIPIVLEQRVEQKFGIISMTTIGDIKGQLTLSPEAEDLLRLLSNSPQAIDELRRFGFQYFTQTINPKNIKYSIKERTLTINGNLFKFNANTLEETLLRAMYGHRGPNKASFDNSELYERMGRGNWELTTKSEREAFFYELYGAARVINSHIGGKHKFIEVHKIRTCINPFLLENK